MNKPTSLLWKTAEKQFLKDEHLALLVAKWGTCRIKKSPPENYFIDLVEIIIGQQLSGKAAETIFGRLKAGFGNKVTPQAILRADIEKLKKYGLSQAKAGYLKDLAGRVKNGSLNLNSLEKLDDRKVSEQLLAVKGIGNWSVEMFLMFSLARPDIFPGGDLGIRRSMEKMFAKKITSEDVIKLSLRWKPFRTAAAWYLWRS